MVLVRVSLNNVYTYIQDTDHAILIIGLKLLQELPTIRSNALELPIDSPRLRYINPQKLTDNPSRTLIKSRCI